jgi:hypothetical protein
LALPLGSEVDPIESNDECRHHVRRQVLAQVSAQIGRGHGHRVPGGVRCCIVGDVVRDDERRT